MDSSEILAWANNVEAIRLPQIEDDITALQVAQADLDWRLTQKSQEINDALAAQTVRLDVLDAAAYNAELTATMALSNLPTTELAARVYTDTAIQNLRDYFTADVVFINNYLAGDYLNLVGNTAAAAVDDRVIEMTTLLGQAAAVENRVNAATSAMQAAVDNLINSELPTLSGEVSQTASDTQTLNTLLNTLLTDFSDSTFQAGLDAIKASAEKSISPLRTSVLREPRSLWGRNLSAPSTTLAKATLGGYGTFLTDDPEFAECFVFGVGDDENIGSAFPLEFSSEKIYKVSVMVRCLDDGVSTNGVDLTIGATTTRSVTVVEADVELQITPTPLLVADGVVTYDMYISGNVAAMDDYGIAAGNRIELIGSTTANKIYTYIRQNKTGTNGQAAVATFTVTDVSEVLLRVLSAESLIQASLDQAEVARIAAETAQSTAEAAKVDAVAAMTNAAGSASAAATSATLASDSATEAGAQATASASSAASASTAATTAGTYASAAETEALNAQTSAGAASVSSSAAATSADNASNSASSASASEALAASILADITNTETGFAGEILSIKALDLSALTGTALATLLNQLNVGVDGTSATVTEQSAAITSINGNAAASYVLRLGAGGAAAGLEIVAADDPIGGAVSSFRVDAGNILLNGSVVAAQLAAGSVTADAIAAGAVTANKIDVTSLSAISATIGTLQSAATGERIVMETDKISVYDSSGTLRVRIGNLL